MIRDLTVRSGVRIDYNSTVVDVDINAPSVTLESGETIHADLVVGADGSYSLVRQKLVGRKEKREIKFQTAQLYVKFLSHCFSIQTHMISHSFQIPIKKLQDDPLLASLTKDGTVSEHPPL